MRYLTAIIWSLFPVGLLLAWLYFGVLRASAFTRLE